MGRKRTPPVTILATQGGTEVPPQDGLPAFQRYIDVRGEKRERKTLTRLFFVTPSVEEIEDWMIIFQSKDAEFTVLGARMPYMNRSVKVTQPLFEYFLAEGFSADFATDLVGLFINHLQGKHMGHSGVYTHALALRSFVDFLATHRERPLALADIDKQIWLDYLMFCEADQRTTAKQLFNSARIFFKNYPPTSLGGWLGLVSFREANRRIASQEHTSELAEERDYSDVVMYQLLALFIEGFQRRIGYLKRYERLGEADMPTDWIYPGRRKRYVPDSEGKKGPGRERSEALEGAAWKRKREPNESETGQLLFKWLSDKEEGYQILIDHFIMHHKAGLLKENQVRGYSGGIQEMLNSHTSKNRKLAPLVREFRDTMALWHDYERDAAKTLIRLYVKKKTAAESNLVINQIGWCLANLLLMQTGINKEVALTIPSKAENGTSILTRGDSLFISKDGVTEIEMYGIKARAGNAQRKIIPITIVKNSPLHQMLVDYERHVKVDFDGPFFEFNKIFIDSWSTAGGLNDMRKIYQVIDKNGEQLSSIDTTRFRKVFASGQLLDRLKGIKDGNELAEKLREDLNHSNLDVTLTNYLLKSSISRSVIDIAIATITSQKLIEGIRFKGKIVLKESCNIKKKVFLCDCEDPTNPSHDIAIAEECKHYDLCLGCERSVITKFHLPYICVRIMQYEHARLLDPHIWPAMYEDRWNIAHDALDKYVVADKKHGRRLVDEARVAAREGLVSLPPIIISNRM
jgi:hypothetical protein